MIFADTSHEYVNKFLEVILTVNQIVVKLIVSQQDVETISSTNKITVLRAVLGKF